MKKVVKSLSLPKENLFCHACRIFNFFLEPSIYKKMGGENMNTGTVSKILGVSQSTVQRWVKHLNLKMERNEYGHYVYSEDDLEKLKLFQKQLQKGVPIQEIAVSSKEQHKEKGKETQESHLLKEKITDLEKKINNKADSVVSYQLLQHRQEIEELKKQLDVLNKKVIELEKSRTWENKQNFFSHNGHPLDQSTNDKQKKKRFFSTLFGY